MGHDDWIPIRDHLMDKLEELGLIVTVDAGWMHRRQAFHYWVIMLRRHKDMNSFAEVHLMSDMTIMVTTIMSFDTREFPYYLSDPSAFDNVILKVKALLKECIESMEHIEDPFR